MDLIFNTYLQYWLLYAFHSFHLYYINRLVSFSFFMAALDTSFFIFDSDSVGGGGRGRIGGVGSLKKTYILICMPCFAGRNEEQRRNVSRISVDVDIFISFLLSTHKLLDYVPAFKTVVAFSSFRSMR
jgi:spore maturation protein CgeB